MRLCVPTVRLVGQAEWAAVEGATRPVSVPLLQGCTLCVMMRKVVRQGCEMSAAAERFAEHGFVFLPNWLAGRSTLDIAAELGGLLDLSASVPGLSIPAVQPLRLQSEAAARANTYSKQFGRAEFPLHNDLAHWFRPPRYMLLRCINGDHGVPTRVVKGAELRSVFGSDRIDRALYRPVRPVDGLSLSLLAGGFAGVRDSVRWDSLFLLPANETAREFRDFMQSVGNFLKGEKQYLAVPGDTLVIDNWRVLHGRAAASRDSPRVIERAYLTRVDL